MKPTSNDYEATLLIPDEKETPPSATVVHEHLTTFAEREASAAAEKTRGSTEHQLSNSLKHYKGKMPELFKDPTYEKFSDFLISAQLDSFPKAVGNGVARGNFFRAAYVNGAASNFILRDRVVRECEASVSENSDESALEKRFRWIHFMHLALTQTELSSRAIFRPSRATESEKMDFYVLSVEVLAELTSYGIEHPKTFEDVYYWLADLKEKEVEAWNETVFNNESDKDIAEREKYISEIRDSIYICKAGVRAEAITNLMLTNLFKEKFPNGFTHNGITITGLQVARSLSEMDLDAIMDWGICGVVHVPGEEPVLDLLIGVDVKSEGSKTMESLGNVAKGSFGNTQVTIALDPKFRKETEDGTYELLTDFGDPTTKPVTTKSDEFVLDTGVPILGVRIPWASDFDPKTQKYINRKLDLKSFADVNSPRNGVRISQEILLNAVISSLKNSIESRYRKENDEQQS